MIPTATLDEIRRNAPVAEIVGVRVRLRQRGNRLVGPCPICSKDPQSRTDARFEITSAIGWVCAACGDGGDVIALVQRVEGLDFLGAIAWLTGSARPRAGPSPKSGGADRRDDRSEARELERCRSLFDASQPAPGTLVEQYLAGRVNRAGFGGGS